MVIYKNCTGALVEFMSKGFTDTTKKDIAEAKIVLGNKIAALRYQFSGNSLWIFDS